MNVTTANWLIYRALWIIMWLIYKKGGDATDEARINKWRHDYYTEGGETLETSGTSND